MWKDPSDLRPLRQRQNYHMHLSILFTAALMFRMPSIKMVYINSPFSNHTLKYWFILQNITNADMTGLLLNILFPAQTVKNYTLKLINTSHPPYWPILWYGPILGWVVFWSLVLQSFTNKKKSSFGDYLKTFINKGLVSS